MNKHFQKFNLSQKIISGLSRLGFIWVVPAMFLMAGQSLGQGKSQSDEAGVYSLRIQKMGTAENSFHVISTLIVGSTESILFDGLYKMSDGKKMAEMIADTGTKLKALILSHADHDHYMGALAVIRQFPGTPVYMTRSGLEDFMKRSESDLAAERRRGRGDEVPDELIKPEVLPSGSLWVDGQEIVVIPDLVGDVKTPSSTALWIPSLRAILAGDLVFEGIHPWLGYADKASRDEWRKSLQRLASFNPKIVVPGHKRDFTAPDLPSQIDFMIQYLDDYDAAMETAATPEDVAKSMQAKYQDLTLPLLMAYGAKKWFKK